MSIIKIIEFIISFYYLVIFNLFINSKEREFDFHFLVPDFNLLNKKVPDDCVWHSFDPEKILF